MEWKNCKTHWYEAASSAPNFPSLKEVSQNCFALMFPTSKMEEVSLNFPVLELVTFIFEACVAELLREIDRLTDRQIDRYDR